MRALMRILMLSQSYAPVVGGEERIVEELSAELVRRGHEVGVATLRQPAGEPPRRDDGVEIHLLDGSTGRIPGIASDPERRFAPPGPDPLTVSGLRRAVREFGPDIVHGHNWLADSYLPLAGEAGPAFVLSLHDYSLVCATKRFFLRGAVCSGPGVHKCLSHSIAHYGAAKGTLIAAGTGLSAPWLRRRVDMFLPVSVAVRDRSGLHGSLPNRVIPNFIGELPPPPEAGDPRLAALPAEPFILYFGDIAEDKGVRLLVEAYRRLPDAPPLALVGRRVIDSLPSVPGLVEVGRLPHALAIEALRRSLFAVAPSLLPESFGIVALEAAAAEKPAIVSDIGGLAEVVRDGETGLLVPPGDVEALAAALGRLAGEPGLRDRMGAAAAERAGSFGPDAVVPRFEDAYTAALEARRRRSLA
jgi:glycosyltransferase involved in cell wall biosynthesis